MNASKQKSQIRISQKRLGFLKNALTKSFLEFLSGFCLACQRLKLRKLRIAFYGQFRFKLVVFSISHPHKKMFSGKVYIQKNPLIILKPLICFESKINLKKLRFKIAIFEFTCFNSLLKFAIHKTSFLDKFLLRLAIKRYQRLAEIHGIVFGRKVSRKEF